MHNDINERKGVENGTPTLYAHNGEDGTKIVLHLQKGFSSVDPNIGQIWCVFPLIFYF